MHSINRNNYEDWLMLYLDNELTVAERHAVEAFAAGHPDVQEEWEALKETMLTPCTPPAMPGLERLLMPEMWNEEALNRQQQQLLMMADGELPVEEKGRLASEMADNPLLQKEWTLIQHSVLVKETPAEMPDKEKLYRQNEPSRIIPIGRILRFAAAASIIGFGWFFVNQRQQNIQEVIEQITFTDPGYIEKDKTEGITITPNQINAPAKASNVIASTTVSDTNTIKKGGGQLLPSGPQPTNSKKQNALYVTTVDNPDVIVENITHDVAVQRPLISSVSIEETNLNEIPVIDKPNSITGDEIALTLAVEKSPVVYEIINPDDWEENETISIAGARIPKQKIRNAYRNITRPLARSFERNSGLRFDVK
jgi:hypothetical protein